MDGKNQFLTIEDALADMQSFQLGEAGTVRYYRDRVGIDGVLMTAIQLVAVMPIVLFCWVFSEAHYGQHGAQSRH